MSNEDEEISRIAHELQDMLDEYKIDLDDPFQCAMFKLSQSIHRFSPSDDNVKDLMTIITKLAQLAPKHKHEKALNHIASLLELIHSFSFPESGNEFSFAE